MGHWPTIAARGVDVVLDFGFFTRRQRDEARALAESVSAQVRLVWVKCSEDVARQWCAERGQDASGYRIDEDAFEWINAKLEPLDADEVHEVVESSGDGCSGTAEG